MTKYCTSCFARLVKIQSGLKPEFAQDRVVERIS